MDLLATAACPRKVKKLGLILKALSMRALFMFAQEISIC